MSIPSTKASTANVDEGSDLLALARPDIKQNIDNVNEIIDHLNNEGRSQTAVIKVDADNLTQGSVGYQTAEGVTLHTMTELVDAGNFVTVNSDSGSFNTLTLADGKYLISLMYEDTFRLQSFNFEIHDDDNDTSNLQWELVINNTQDLNTPATRYFDTADFQNTLTVRFGYNNVIAGDGTFDGHIMIQKLG